MTKLTVKNAHNLDLEMLNEDDLRILAANLIRSREDAKAAAKGKQDFANEQVKKQGKINAIMMPQIAAMMEALADRAGLSKDPSVCKAIKLIGDQTYTQWSGPVEDLPELTIDAEPAVDPRAGDAEMVLSSKIDEHVQVLKSAVDYGHIKGDLADAVCGLINGIDDHMETAIAEGFKALGADWKPVPQVQSRDDIDVSHATLHDLLSELSMDIDFGAQVLRRDLRAGMYRQMAHGIQLACYIANGLYVQGAPEVEAPEMENF
jgi:hypothetical protein